MYANISNFFLPLIWLKTHQNEDAVHPFIFPNDHAIKMWRPRIHLSWWETKLLMWETSSPQWRKTAMSATDAPWIYECRSDMRTKQPIFVWFYAGEGGPLNLKELLLLNQDPGTPTLNHLFFQALWTHRITSSTGTVTPPVPRHNDTT